MGTILSNYVAQPYQERYHRAKNRFKAILGGIRSGKTYPTAREFYKRVCYDWSVKYNRTKDLLLYWVATPNYGIGKVITREIFATIYDHDKNHVKDWKRSYKELWLYPNILVEFKSTSNPNTLVAVALRGLLVDEAARIQEEAWFGGLRGRLTDYSGWGLFATSSLGRNWFYREILRRGNKRDQMYDPEYINFVFKTSQNKYIPSKEIEAARRQLPPHYFRREYEACLDDFYGKIYFVGNEHFYKSHECPKEFDRYICGIDWGYTEPGCLMVFGITNDHNSDKREYWELETIHRREILICDDVNVNTWLGYTKEARRKYPDIVFFPGKEKPEHTELFKRNGINILETDYSVDAGIQTLSRLFKVTDGKTRIHFRDSLQKDVKDEFYGYRWKEKSGETKDEPFKKDDHGPDAARYAIHSYEMLGMGKTIIISPEDDLYPDWYNPKTFMHRPIISGMSNEAFHI